MDYGVRAIIPDEDLDHATELAPWMGEELCSSQQFQARLGTATEDTLLQ